MAPSPAARLPKLPKQIDRTHSSNSFEPKPVPDCANICAGCGSVRHFVRFNDIYDRLRIEELCVVANSANNSPLIA